MILVIKNEKVFATHTDDQSMIDKYPSEYEIIKVSDGVVEYPKDEEGNPTGLPDDPRLNGASYVDMRTTKTDLEILKDTVEKLVIESLRSDQNV